MKYLRLYEYFSELGGFNKSAIAQMTDDEFFSEMENYKRTGEIERAFSFMQMYMHTHPESKKNQNFLAKIGAYVNLFNSKLDQATMAEFEFSREAREINDEIMRLEGLLKKAKEKKDMLASEYYMKHKI
jgi:hypothetical protein